MEIEDQLESPDGVMVNEQGYIYVSDQDKAKIYKFDPYGKLVLQWGQSYEPEEGLWRRNIQNQERQQPDLKEYKEDGEDLYIPAGMAGDNFGRIYVVEQNYQMIQLFGLPDDMGL